MDKEYIISIDVGIKNIGLSMLSITSYEDVIVEKSSLLETRDGRVYKEYEEGYADEMVYYWLQDRWDSYFSKARIVVIEKQYTTMQSALERGCLVIETCLRAYFRAALPFGGPLYLTLHPMWWKGRVGVEVGNNKTPDVPAKFVKGKYVPAKRNMDYGVHKTRARNFYFQLVQDNDTEAGILFKKRGREISTDEIEAYLFARAVKGSLDEVIDQAKETMHHNAALSTENKINRMSKKKRRTELKPYFNQINKIDSI